MIKFTRGDTLTLEITVEGIELSDVDDLRIYIKQGSLLIQKNIEDVDINDDVINVYFSESETLKLTTEKCKLQARFNINSNIVASDIIYFSPKALIKDEVMLNES